MHEWPDMNATYRKLADVDPADLPSGKELIADFKRFDYRDDTGIVYQQCFDTDHDNLCIEEYDAEERRLMSDSSKRLLIWATISFCVALAACVRSCVPS